MYLSNAVIYEYITEKLLQKAKKLNVQPRFANTFSSEYGLIICILSDVIHVLLTN